MAAPTNRTSLQVYQETSQQIHCRQEVYDVVRQYMPIGPLASATISKELPRFYKDQELLHRVAQLINELPKESIKEKIALHESNAVKDLFSSDKDTYLSHFLTHCSEAHGDTYTCPKRLEEAVQSRIFTIKNALIAQQKPELILNKLKELQIKSKSKKTIQDLGKDFVKMALSCHFLYLRADQRPNFQENLQSTVNSLFHSNRIYAKKIVPDSLPPSDDKNDMYHSAVATGMCFCLHGFGYKAEILTRENLEVETVRTRVYSLVLVEDLKKKKKFIVDPSYLRIIEAAEPEPVKRKNLVLVLPIEKINTYVKENLTEPWEKLYEATYYKNPKMPAQLGIHFDKHQKIVNKDLQTPHMAVFTRIKTIDQVKKAFQDVYDVSSYITW